MDQYDHGIVKKRMLAPCVLHNATKQGRNNHHAVNRIETRLITWYHVIPISRSVIDYTTEGAPVCDTASRMIAKLAVHAAVNIIELIKQTLVLLQTPPFFDQGFLWPIKAMWVRCILAASDCEDSEQHYAWSPRTLRLHILQTIMGSWPVRAETLRYDNRNSGRLQFDLYQSQTDAGKHFFLHETP